MPLVLQRNVDGDANDYHVRHGALQVGRIYKRAGAPRRPEAQWLWALNGVPGGPADLRLTGLTATLENAQAGLQESWSKWLAWADLSEKD